MAASERSRLIAEITLRHPDLVLSPTIEAVPAVRTKLEYQSIVPPDGYYLFFKAELESDAPADGSDAFDAFDAFDEAVATDHTVAEPTVIIDADEFRVYRMRLVSSSGLVLPKAAALGMRVLRAESRSSNSSGGGWIATLEVPALEALDAFRRYCRDHDVGFTVERLFHAADDSGEAFGLTPVQERTLVEAFENGYFNEPRETSVEELANSMGVSSSAVSGRLRRGLRLLLENTLARER